MRKEHKQYVISDSFALFVWLLLPWLQNREYYYEGDNKDQDDGNHHAFSRPLL